MGKSASARTRAEQDCLFGCAEVFLLWSFAFLGVRLQGTSVLHSPDSGLRRGLQLRIWFSHGPLEATPWKGASTTTPPLYETTFARQRCRLMQLPVAMVHGNDGVGANAAPKQIAKEQVAMVVLWSSLYPQ